jgi:hypothetical protein
MLKIASLTLDPFHVTLIFGGSIFEWVILRRSRKPRRGLTDFQGLRAELRRARQPPITSPRRGGAASFETLYTYILIGSRYEYLVQTSAVCRYHA